MNKYLWLCSGVSLVLLIGCAQSLPEKTTFSGFITEYNTLQESESASGKKILRWVDPNFDINNYDNIVYEPVIYYPSPKTTYRVEQSELRALLDYANQKIKSGLQQHKSVVSKPAGRSLIFRAAVTRIDSETQDFQLYELIPAGLVIATTQMASGHRTMTTDMYFEGELVDSTTGNPVIREVRKDAGLDLANESKPITVETMKQAIDHIASDIGQSKVMRNLPENT